MSETTRTETLGVRLARAIAAKDEAALRAVLAGVVADTLHAGYRFDLATPGGSFVAERQAYHRGTDVIEHLRVMCSGFRPR